MSNEGGSGSSAGVPRSAAVRDVFPKLAYTTSDVVVMVGTEPFFSTRYLERVLSFAARANAGVGDADLPILLLLCNRRDADACILDIKTSTAQFYEAMGDAAGTLDQYFSALLAVYLPNKRSLVTGVSEGGGGPSQGQVFDGSQLYSEQIAKVRACLAALMNSRLLTRYGGLGGSGGMGGASPVLGAASSHPGLSSRSITSRQGLWYELLPRVVQEINAGKTVSVMRLVDEAWNAALASSSAGVTGVLSGGEGDLGARVGDVIKSFSVVLRPPPPHSCTRGGAPEYFARFDAYLSLALDLATRVGAAHLRGLPISLRIPERCITFAVSKVRQEKGSHTLCTYAVTHTHTHSIPIVLQASTIRLACDLVGETAPCAALHPGGVTPCEDGISDPSVACLQEKRAHTKGHRSSRKVTGGGKSLWDRVANSLIGYTPVWSGAWQAPLVQTPDIPALAQTSG